MSRRFWSLLAAVVVVVLAIGVLEWTLNRSDPIPSAVPAGAPAVGSCAQVDPSAARGLLPWPGGSVACTAGHTTEVYHVGQVDHDLIKRARSGGRDGPVASNLMLAEVRRACGAFATRFLGLDWHKARVTVLADWISPQRDGFFGCALAQTIDAAGTRFATRSASLKGAADQVAAACVTRGSDGSLYVSCDEEHEGEFAGTYTLTPPDAPFEAQAVKDSANRGCGEVVRAYLGLSSSANRTDLSVGYVGPTTAQTWLGSDQTFACYALADVKLRGSIRSLGARPLPQ
ncbi:hypothetical protein GCM10023322_66910 [Rugosimonospora acidiphila]|uniref:Septum formation-related domain-containing protein n=1 Tax=Rugosimonospora acidiphila TaxID=556531 RepID=A0ABP9SL14_9ACTN